MHLLRDRGYTHPVPSEITPRSVYLSRRRWMAAGAAALGTAGAALLSAPAGAQGTPRPGRLAPLPATRSSVAGAVVMD
ncbi:MAG: protein-methionine-sulfoxide reductase catalytic subunit MsrP, partial [Pseudomonadota bacterium]